MDAPHTTTRGSRDNNEREQIASEPFYNDITDNDDSNCSRHSAGNNVDDLAEIDIGEKNDSTRTERSASCLSDKGGLCGDHLLAPSPSPVDERSSVKTESPENSRHDAAFLNLQEDDVALSRWPIPLYIPNLMCYLRVILSFYSLNNALKQNSRVAVNMWTLSCLLDLVDGMAARRFHQCSQFGVLLDVAADNILRSTLWMASIIELLKYDYSMATESCVMLAIVCLEWITLLCSQLQALTISLSRPKLVVEESLSEDLLSSDKKNWKNLHSGADTIDYLPPFWIQSIFKNNFRTPPGILAVYGLFVAPFGTFIWLADRSSKTWPTQLLSEDVTLFLVQLSYLGRMLAASAEFWICTEYFRSVIVKETRTKMPKG